MGFNRIQTARKPVGSGSLAFTSAEQSPSIGQLTASPYINASPGVDPPHSADSERTPSSNFHGPSYQGSEKFYDTENTYIAGGPTTTNTSASGSTLQPMVSQTHVAEEHYTGPGDRSLRSNPFTRPPPPPRLDTSSSIAATSISKSYPHPRSPDLRDSASGYDSWYDTESIGKSRFETSSNAGSQYHISEAEPASYIEDSRDRHSQYASSLDSASDRWTQDNVAPSFVDPASHDLHSQRDHYYERLEFATHATNGEDSPVVSNRAFGMYESVETFDNAPSTTSYTNLSSSGSQPSLQDTPMFRNNYSAIGNNSNMSLPHMQRLPYAPDGKVDPLVIRPGLTAPRDLRAQPMRSNFASVSPVTDPAMQKYGAYGASSSQAVSGATESPISTTGSTKSMGIQSEVSGYTGYAKSHLSSGSTFQREQSDDSPLYQQQEEPFEVADQKDEALGIGIGSAYVQRLRADAGETHISRQPMILPLGLKRSAKGAPVNVRPEFLRRAMDIRYKHLPQRMLETEVDDDEDDKTTGSVRDALISENRPAPSDSLESSRTSVVASRRSSSPVDSIIEQTGRIKLFVANPDDD